MKKNLGLIGLALIIIFLINRFYALKDCTEWEAGEFSEYTNKETLSCVFEETTTTNDGVDIWLFVVGFPLVAYQLIKNRIDQGR